MLNISQLNFRDTMALPPSADSDSILAGLQNTFGAQKYTQQSVSRYPYYSYVAYPLAGGSSISFFGSNQSQLTQQLTNIENANSLANYSMLISSISFDVFLYLPTVANNAPWSYTTDALAPYADIVHGFTQGGYSQFTVNNTVWDEVDLPFMFSPSAIGKTRLDVSMSGMDLSQGGMSPFAVTGSQTVLCYADVERRAWRRRNLKNKIFLAPQTTFDMSIFYDFGPIPVIATSAITNAANPPAGPAIMVGCRFDGLRFAPVS